MSLVENEFSIKNNNKTKAKSEKVMHVVFTVCALMAVTSVVAITLYMIIAGTPALFKVGIKDILFGTEWLPGQDKFGIFYIILTSVVGTLSSVAIGVPIGLMTAVYLAEIADKKSARIVKPAVELLAGIPSVVYGLLGILLIKPAMKAIEMLVYEGSTAHQFTGGANLLASIFVLAIMILPTVINVSETALKSVPNEYREASLALGATKIQTIFRVIIPAAKSGIVTSIVLGIGRAIGEAMAIVMVSGNAVNIPLPFNSVRFLTTGIVSEMSYSTGLHRQVLFTIGLVLFVFIMIINLVLNKYLKGGRNDAE